jgi:hypothetical protein
MHGWGITELIEQRSENLLSVKQGSPYPGCSSATRIDPVRALRLE